MSIRNSIFSSIILCAVVQISSAQIDDCTIVDTSRCYINIFFESEKIVLEKKIEIEEITLAFHTSLLVDVNLDCVPEIISTTGYKNIIIIDSKTGDIINRIITPSFIPSPTNFTVADINSDGIPEFFVLIELTPNLPFSESGRIICYNLDGTKRWVSDEQHIDWARRSINGNLGIADFNQDGISEVYIGNKIFNAQTGILLAEGGNFGEGLNAFSRYSLAGQFDDDISDLELAGGYSVYKVNINNTNGMVGNSMTSQNIIVDGKFRDGVTSLADMNNDGILDIIVNSEDSNKEPRLYIYTVANGIPKLLAKTTPPPNPILYARNLFGTSTPVIGNIDSSNNPIIIISREHQLLSYSYDGSNFLVQKWSIPTTDESGTTGATLFDLNNDGIMEIIYRDESHLRIIDGSKNPPINIDRFICNSGTGIENPIVGDIFGTRQAHICVTCSETPRGSRGHITIFGSPDTLAPWAPARRVWNQYAYHGFNINDDLTVPRVQKNNATYENGRHNNFIVQQSLLDRDGNYRQRAAGLHGVIHCINYDIVTDQYTVIFDIFNRTDASLTALTNLPIAFYNGDPQAGGTLIGVYYTTSDIAPGQSLLNLTFTFSAPGLTRLFMVVNTDKSNLVGVDDDFFQPECDFLDNFSQNTELPEVRRLVDSFCMGDDYDFMDTVITEVGTYTRSLLDVNGCDSIVAQIELTTTDTIHRITEAMACDSFVWKGNVYRNSGTFSEDYPVVDGCDSTVTLKLTISRSTQFTLLDTACNSYIWKGDNYTQSGVYAFDTLNSEKCDSAVTLNLTIHNSHRDTINLQVCNSYTWHGQFLDQNGTYTFDTINSLGCDSMLWLILEIQDTIETMEAFNICQGDSILVFDEYIFEEKQVSKAFKTSEGCDSLHSVDILIDPLQYGSISKSICEGDSIFIIDQWLKDEGKTQISKSNVDDCDSVFQVDIIHKFPVSTFDTIPLCEGDTLVVFGREVTEEMDLLETYTGSNGCDSSSEVHVAMQRASKSNRTVQLCPGDSIIIDGQWIKEEGTYTQSFDLLDRCDSIVTYEISVLEAPNPPSVEVDCENLEIIASVVANLPWKIQWDNGDTTTQTTYSGSSTATLTLSAPPNCQQEYTLNLPPIPDITLFSSPNDTILESGGSLTLDIGLDTDDWTVLWAPTQWMDCDTCMRVVITAPSEGQINILLTHSSGCTFEFSFLIKYANEGIFIPNVFTPNGDGINDGWTAFFTPNINITRCWVFDRWGELVYLSEEGQNFNWDGNFNGEKAPSAVYTYLVEYQDSRGKDRKVAGDVTLMR